MRSSVLGATGTPSKFDSRAAASRRGMRRDGAAAFGDDGWPAGGSWLTLGWFA